MRDESEFSFRASSKISVSSERTTRTFPGMDGETFRNACQGKTTVILPHADARARARALQIAREEPPGRDLERQTRRSARTVVRLGRAGRQRTTAAHRRRSPKSACPLSLMNLRRGSSPSRGEGGKGTPVCPVHGSARRANRRRAMATVRWGFVLSARSLRHSPASTAHLFAG